MDYEEKYVKLKPEGVVKGVDDTIQKLEKYDLHNKGLSKSLKVLKKILEDDLPRLKEQWRKDFLEQYIHDNYRLFGLDYGVTCFHA